MCKNIFVCVGIVDFERLSRENYLWTKTQDFTVQNANLTSLTRKIVGRRCP